MSAATSFLTASAAAGAFGLASVPRVAATMRTRSALSASTFRRRRWSSYASVCRPRARHILRDQRLPQAIQRFQARDAHTHAARRRRARGADHAMAGAWCRVQRRMRAHHRATVRARSVRPLFFVICLGGFALDAIKRIRAWQPVNRADWLGDLLYLPEALYWIGLAVVMLVGPGPWRLDAMIATLLAT